MSKTTEANEVHHIEVPSPEKVKVAKKNTQRCSSCGKWKTPDLFDGKATCNECRPKKRRQGAVAVAEKRATMDKIGEQNTTLMFLVKQQAMELAQRRIEDQRQKEIIVHMQREIKQLRAFIETKGRSVYAPEKPEANINAPDLLAAAMTWTQQHQTPDNTAGDAEQHINKKAKTNPPNPSPSFAPSLADYAKLAMLPPFAPTFKNQFGMDYNFFQGNASMPPQTQGFASSFPFANMVCSAE